MTHSIPFDNSYSRLPSRFFARATPEKVSEPKLIAWNDSLADELGIQFNDQDPAVKATVFSGNAIPAGAEPIALAYAGHQFGNFVPVLGDGRAHLLGEVIDRQGKRQDIQLKGSGATPFSRRGDGRSSLGPVVREYLLSEAMHALGVPTTRALAAVTTGELVYREQPLPGGVFTRVAESHVRVGSFEYFAARQDVEALGILLEYAAQRHYPHLEINDELPLSFFKEVVSRQASLIAQWMSLGFIHGVMNTDNTSVGGLTIDFGPCAFMDEFQSDKVFSFIDQQGRYAYANQPKIGVWNLACLARALWPLFKTSEEDTTASLQHALDAFQPQFEQHWLARMKSKLGIDNGGEVDHDRQVVSLWLTYLEQESLDFTMSFRNLARLVTNAQPDDSLFPQTAAFDAFFRAWNRRIKEQDLTAEKIANSMNQINPLFIPRNHQVERAIASAYEGDFSVMRELGKVLTNPFVEQPGSEAYALPPRAEERVTRTFCGT